MKFELVILQLKNILIIFCLLFELFLVILAFINYIQPLHDRFPLNFNDDLKIKVVYDVFEICYGAALAQNPILYSVHLTV